MSNYEGLVFDFSTIGKKYRKYFVEAIPFVRGNKRTPHTKVPLLIRQTSEHSDARGGVRSRSFLELGKR
jgi:hypothetical protein